MYGDDDNRLIKVVKNYKLAKYLVEWQNCRLYV
jgi:hypothetical protein